MQRAQEMQAGRTGLARERESHATASAFGVGWVPMSTINENVKKLAPDLTKDFPASPHAMLAGYILAQRAVDKCRADLVGKVGDYHFDCPLDNMFLGFAGIKGSDLKDFVATGADDAAVGQWIEKNAKKRERVEIIKWNNDLRYKRLSECPDQLQEYMEDYIPKNVPQSVIRHIRYFFDIFDCEEKRWKPVHE